MKIIRFNSDELTPSLALVSSVAPIKSSLPILNDVRIETKQGQDGGSIVELTTSDGETWLQWQTPITEAEVGILLCIEAKALLQALKNLNGKTITMNIDDEKHIVVCKYDNGKFSLPYEKADDFPTPSNNMDGAKEVKVDGKRIRMAMERTGFASSSDELRPVMTGVRFEFFKDGMVTVATDGHKLAKYKDLTITSDEEEMFGFTMPKRPCGTLMNVLASTIDSNIDVEFNDRCLVVSNTQFKMTARLLEGRYPNYDAVIPKTNDKIVNIDKATFITALKRVLPMGSLTSELVALTFYNGEMTISAEDFEFSKSASEVVGCDYSPELPSFSIGFKGSSLLQLLQNIDCDTVKISLAEPSRAGIITEGEENNTYDYTSLIMPMLLAN